MPTPKITRRTRVLAALSDNPRTAYSLARETGLKQGNVSDVLDALSRNNLVEQHPRGWIIGTGLEAQAARAEARAALECATVQATEQPKVAENSTIHDGAELHASLVASGGD